MNKSKLWMVLGGAAVLAVSVIAMWRFSLPNWGVGVAVLGSILGFSAMATPLVPEQQGEAGEPSEPGAGTPEAQGDTGGGNSDGGGGGGE